MIGRIQDVQRQCGNNPIVVHCRYCLIKEFYTVISSCHVFHNPCRREWLFIFFSDGGGRTGAFCALVTSLERVKQDQSFNLFQTIMLERIQRPRMVSSIVSCRVFFLDDCDLHEVKRCKQTFGKT